MQGRAGQSSPEAPKTGLRETGKETGLGVLLWLVDGGTRRVSLCWQELV